MLIIGTGALASDLLSSFDHDKETVDLVFFDDTQSMPKNYIKDNFRLLTTLEEAKTYFINEDPRFIVAVGDNRVRKQRAQEFEAIGGENINYISSTALIAKYVTIGEKGTIIMHRAVINNGVHLGIGNVIYTHTSLGHDTYAGEYVLISAEVCTSRLKIGDFVTLGISCVPKPGITIENDVMIGAGSVITKDVPPYAIMVGNPAHNIKDARH